MRLENLSEAEHEFAASVLQARRKLRDHGRIEVFITPKQTQVIIVHRDLTTAFPTRKLDGG